MPLTLAVWGSALVIGFALLYLPFTEQVAFTQDGDADWWTALYLSGYSATTLGVGDVFFDNSALRILTTLEAALGFALITVGLTYLISVYNALLTSSALALNISTFIGLDDCRGAVDLLADVHRCGRESELVQWLSTTSTQLATATVAQQRYPLVQYFHATDDQRALPVALEEYFTLLVLCRAVLDPLVFPGLSTGPTSAWAERLPPEFLKTRVTQLALPVASVHDDGERTRAARALRDRLVDHGVPARPADESARLYAKARGRFDDEHALVLKHFGYQLPERRAGS